MDAERHLSPEDEQQMESDIISSVMASLFPPSGDDDNNNNKIRTSVRFTETVTEITTNNHADVTSFTEKDDVKYYNNNGSAENYDVIKTGEENDVSYEDDVTYENDARYDINEDEIKHEINEVRNENHEAAEEETNEFGFNLDDIIGNLGRVDNEEENERNDETAAFEIPAESHYENQELEEASNIIDSVLDAELEMEFQVEDIEKEILEQVENSGDFNGENYEKVEEEFDELQDQNQVQDPERDYENSEELEINQNFYENVEEVIEVQPIETQQEAIIDDNLNHDDVIYDDVHDDEAFREDLDQEKLHHDDVIAELKEELKVKKNDGCTCTCTCKCGSRSHSHSGVCSESVEASPTSLQAESQVKQRNASTPATSGKFVLRTVARANPQHVVKYVTENQEQTSQHNPEHDELVTYLKGSEDGGSIKNRISSLIASPLIQQFNKEAQSENIQTFLPKQSGVLVKKEIILTTKVNNGAREERPPEPTSQGGEMLSNPQVEKLELETISDPQARNAEIAKAIEAAQFKPSHTQPSTGRQVSRVSGAGKTSEETREKTVSVAQGISIYSKQPYTVPESARVGVSAEGRPLDWKAEVQRRKQANEFLVAQRLNEPMRLGQVPEWKKVLLEKNKQRKESSNEGEESGPRNGSSSSDHGLEEQEWQKEIRQILREKERNGSTPNEEEVPEWQRLANRK